VRITLSPQNFASASPLSRGLRQANPGLQDLFLGLAGNEKTRTPYMAWMLRGASHLSLSEPCCVSEHIDGQMRSLSSGPVKGACNAKLHGSTHRHFHKRSHIWRDIVACHSIDSRRPRLISDSEPSAWVSEPLIRTACSPRPVKLSKDMELDGKSQGQAQMVN
jgi:hypothetical protein